MGHDMTVCVIDSWPASERDTPAWYRRVGIMIELLRPAAAAIYGPDRDGHPSARLSFDRQLTEDERAFVEALKGLGPIGSSIDVDDFGSDSNPDHA